MPSGRHCLSRFPPDPEVKRDLYRFQERAPSKDPRPREFYEVEVPAIVTEAEYNAVQQALALKKTHSRRNTKVEYLLRGLVKCGACGSSYIGYAGGNGWWHYTCAARRGAYINRSLGLPVCTAPTLSKRIDDLIWTDIEGFLSNPGRVLDELTQQRGLLADEEEKIRREVARLTRDLDAKARERNQVIALCRKEIISEAEMVAQRADILREEEALKVGIARLQGQADLANLTQGQLAAADGLLHQLQTKAAEPWTFERKRQVVELLVEGITVIEDDEGRPVLKVRYSFGPRECDCAYRCSRHGSP